MTDSYRKERIERLFEELQYEITRGVMDHDIAERMRFTFAIPVSAEGEDWAVMFVADLRPMPRWSARLEADMGKLKVIAPARERDRESNEQMALNFAPVAAKLRLIEGDKS